MEKEMKKKGAKESEEERQRRRRRQRRKRESIPENLERLVWEFDKRKTTDASAVELLPRPQALPEAFDPRWRLAGSKTAAGGWKRGKKVSRALYETLKAQVREINACIDWILEREEKVVR